MRSSSRLVAALAVTVSILVPAAPARAADPLPTPAPTPAFVLPDAASVVVSPTTASGPASGGSVADITVTGASGPLPVWFGPNRATVLTEQPAAQGDDAPTTRYEVLVPAGEEGTVDVTLGGATAPEPGTEPTETSDGDFTYVASPDVAPLTPTEPQCGDAYRFDIDPQSPTRRDHPVRIGGRMFRTTPVDDDTISFLRPRPALLPGVKYGVDWNGLHAGYLQDGCFSRVNPDRATGQFPGIRNLDANFSGPRFARQGEWFSMRVNGIDPSAELWIGDRKANETTARWSGSGREGWRLDAATFMRPDGPNGEYVGSEGDHELSVRTSDGKTTYGQTSAENDLEIETWTPKLRAVAPATGPVGGGNRIRIALSSFVPGVTRVLIDGRPATNVTVKQGTDPYDASWNGWVVSATVPAGTGPGPVELRLPLTLLLPPDEYVNRDIVGTYTYDDAPPTPSPTPAPTCDRPAAPDEAIDEFRASATGTLTMYSLLSSTSNALRATGTTKHCYVARSSTSTLTFDPLRVQLAGNGQPRPPLLATMVVAPTGPLVTTTDAEGITRSVMKVRFKFPSVTMLGVELATGSGCQTKLASSLTFIGAATTFSVSELSGCGFLTGLINTTVAGTRNTMVLNVASTL